MKIAADIPTLDFSLFTQGTSSQREKFCKALIATFQRFGFLKLINYGIEPEEVEELFTWVLSRRFFALKKEQKMQCPHPPVPNPHRGYSYVGQEFTSSLAREKEKADRGGRRLIDLKESFDFGAAHDQKYPNVWPREQDLPGFRNFIEQFYVKAHDVHINIMRALAEALGITPDFFIQAHEADESEMRLAHYPEVPASELGIAAGTSRISEHTDSGSATLLWMDDVGGLEAEDPLMHEFVPIEAHHPTLLINVGDAMERWSNGTFPAAYHRVGQPKDQDPSGIVPSRISIPYFGKPDRRVSLSPLPQFITANRPAKYSDATGAELNQKTLLQTYEPSTVSA